MNLNRKGAGRMSAAPRRGFTGGKRAKDARGTLKRLIGYIAKGNKARLVCVFILLIISTVASVSASLFLKSLIDDYIAPLIGQSAPSFAPLLQALTMMGCIYLAGMLASYLQTRLIYPRGAGHPENHKGRYVCPHANLAHQVL